jgi:hypothetical protein
VDFALQLANLGNLPLDRVDDYLDSLPYPYIRVLHERLYEDGNLMVFGLVPKKGD